MQVLQHVRLMHPQSSSNDVTSVGVPTTVDTLACIFLFTRWKI